MGTGTLAAFLAVDLLLVFTPGADWAYAIAAGLRNRSVLPAVAGLAPLPPPSRSPCPDGRSR